MAKILQEKVDQALDFIHKNCLALGIYVFAFVSAKDPAGPEVVSVGRWVGIPLPDNLKSKAPRYAPLKALELMGVELPSEKLLTTPVQGVSTLNLMGGARYITAEVDLTVAVSKLLEQHDLLLAVTALYATVFPAPLVGPKLGEAVFLHHVGFRYTTSAEYWSAADASRGTQLIRHADDHLRTYINVGQHYIEFQYFLNGPYTTARHLDFVAREPKRFLTFVASAFGKQPDFWDEEPKSPVGCLWIEGDEGTDPIGIMARPQWWTVEQE